VKARGAGEHGPVEEPRVGDGGEVEREGDRKPVATRAILMPQRRMPVGWPTESDPTIAP